MDNDTIYDHKRRLDLLENRIKNASYPEKDKNLILKYEDYLFAIGLSVARVVKYLTQLNTIASKWGVSF